MADQQHNAPDQYFTASDGGPPAPDGGDGDETSYATSYGASDPGNQIQQQQHHFLYHGGGSSVQTGAHPQYGFVDTGNTGHGFHSADAGWHQPQPMYHGANPGSDAAHQALPFGFHMDAHPGEHVESSAIGHGQYVAPLDTTLQLGYGYDWEPQDGMEYGTPPLQSPLGTGAATPSSFVSSSSGTPYQTVYAGATNVHAPAGTGMGDEAERTATPIPSRVSRRSSAQTGKGLAGGSAEGGSSSALAGPSGHSSHTQRRGSAAKGKHNMVEKQYRVRLNNQFDNLMAALPESLKLAGTGANAVHDGTGGMPPDVIEQRKLSKAEVLEMARIHIQSLEQEMSGLKHERNALLAEIKRLQTLYASRPGPSDAQGS